MPIQPLDRELEETVRRAFAFISSSSVPTLMHSQYSPEHFGDAIVELLGDKVSVRVFRDKGQILVELGPSHSAVWFDEEIVLESVGHPPRQLSFEEASRRTVDDVARAIKENLGAIVQSFERKNWKTTRADLEARLERRGEALIAQLSQGRPSE